MTPTVFWSNKTVEGIFQYARYAESIFGRADEHGVGLLNSRPPMRYGGQGCGAAFVVGIAFRAEVRQVVESVEKDHRHVGPQPVGYGLQHQRVGRTVTEASRNRQHSFWWC